jgi:hypothetical protein
MVEFLCTHDEKNCSIESTHIERRGKHTKCNHHPDGDGTWCRNPGRFQSKSIDDTVTNVLHYEALFICQQRF